MRKFATVCLTSLCACLWAAGATANTSHAGWPPITGMLLMNKQDQSRPLDGRPGHDPFDGTDYSVPCSGSTRTSHCVPGGLPALVNGVSGALCSTLGTLSAPLGLGEPSCAGAPPRVVLVPSTIGHNELLGGHGNDVIHAGPAGDVLWGDYKPSGQPTSQTDSLYGGPGNDFIYASHGTNYIWTGGGQDVVHAHFGRGAIHCDSSTVTVYLSHASRRGYRLFGCRRISYRTTGH